MTNLKHEELQIAKNKIERSYHPKSAPEVAIPCAADAWDGLALGFTIVGLAGYFGLSVPVLPLIIGGVFVAGFFFIHKAMEMHRAKRKLLKRLRAIDESIITENHYQHWKQILPQINNGVKIYALEDYIHESSEDTILVQLAYRYRRITHYIDQAIEQDIDQARIQHLKSIKSRLALQIAGEVSHIDDVDTGMKINKYLGQTLVSVQKEPAKPQGKRMLDSISQYTKSVLDGVSTGANIPYTLSLVFMLTTTILTVLFPWTFLIIGVLAIAGGIIGYKLDKYYDNKAAINEERINQAERSVKIKKSYINLIVQTKFAEQEINKAVQNHQHPQTIITELAAGYALPAGECIEAKRLRNPPPSPFIRKMSKVFPSLLTPKGRRNTRNVSRAISLTFQSLLSGKRGFDVISDIFYGVVFTTSVGLVFLPFAIIGLAIGVCYLVNKTYRGIRKYQTMDEDISSLNSTIKPIKYTHWEHELGMLGIKQNVHTYVQQNDVEVITQQLIKEYRALDQKIQSFDRAGHFPEAKQKLAAVKKQLQIQISIHADEMHDETRADQLRQLAGLTAEPVKPAKSENLTRGARVKRVFKKGWAFCVENYKDLLRGFGLGTGIALTIFAAIGVTTLMSLMPYSLLIIAGAGLVGVGIKMLIRHAFKKPRWAECDAIKTARENIEDKAQIMDALVTTKRLTMETKDIIRSYAPEDDIQDLTAHSPSPKLSPIPSPTAKSTRTSGPSSDNETAPLVRRDYSINSTPEEEKPSHYLKPWLSKLWQDQPKTLDGQENQATVTRPLF